MPLSIFHFKPKDGIFLLSNELGTGDASGGGMVIA
jgi:hypothetical protein